MAPKKKPSHSSKEPSDLPKKSSSSSKCIFPTLSTRSIANGRLVDFNFLAQEEFKIGNLLSSQGWSSLLSTKKPIFPNLIREFYENINFGDGTITSMVKNVKIQLDEKLLGSALGIPSNGFLQNFPSERDYKVAAILGLEDDDANIVNLDANMLSVENRLLHSIIAKIFAPRAGSFNAVTDRDICIMYDILDETPLNFPELMMIIMKEAVSRSKAALPYGMFLTYVFEFHHVKLKGETSVALRHTDIFNAHSLHRMDYAKRNGVWTKVRSRTGDKPSLQPTNLAPSDPPPPACSSPSFFNFDFNQPNAYLAAMTEPSPFVTEPPEMPDFSTRQDNSSSTLPTVRICEEQIRQIIRELTLAQSSRSTGDSSSSVTDFTIVPHISSVFETLSQLIMTQRQLVHAVGVLNGRMFHHNDSLMDRMLKEVDLLKSKFENFENKAEWVTYQMRSSESRTKDAANAFDHLNASTVKLSSLVETYIALSAASAPDASFSHPNLWMPPQPPADDDVPGPSSRPDGSSHIISSDDD